MRFAYGQIRVILVAARLRALGASEQTLGRAVTTIEAMGEDAWSARVVVTPEGDLRTPLGDLDDGYLIDLARIRPLGILAAA